MTSGLLFRGETGGQNDVGSAGVADSMSKIEDTKLKVKLQSLLGDKLLPYCRNNEHGNYGAGKPIMLL